VARALTVEEQQRYPWASRIIDYVPVGTLRKVGLWAAVLALVCFLAGTVALALVAVDIRDTLGRITLAVSGVLAVAGFVLGLVGLIPALMRSATGPLLWSLAAMVPGLAAAATVLLLGS